MKCRACFVSNSSSCSSIVMLPDDFKPDWNAYKDLMDENETDEKSCQEVYDILISEGCLWEEGHHLESCVLRKMFREKNMVIASVECSSDAGQIVIADRKKIDKIIKGVK